MSDLVQYRAAYICQIVLRDVVFRERDLPALKVAGAETLASMIQTEAPLRQAVYLHELKCHLAHVLLVDVHVRKICYQC